MATLLLLPIRAHMIWGQGIFESIHIQGPHIYLCDTGGMDLAEHMS